jgi:hypothetical protein
MLMDAALSATPTSGSAGWRSTGIASAIFISQAASSGALKACAAAMPEL